MEGLMELLFLLILAYAGNKVLCYIEPYFLHMLQREKEIKSIMNPLLKEAKKKKLAKERFLAKKEIYERYGYKPIMALRSSAGLIVQIPLFLSGYLIITNSQTIMSASLGSLSFGSPDGLLFGYNLLPVLMTVFSILSCILSPLFNRTEKQNTIFLALIFFVVLYNQPFALLVFWTFNNLLYFVKTVFKRKARDIF